MNTYTNPKAFAERVLQRISHPENWCQGASATTATGAVCTSWSPEACRWCVFGACGAEAYHSGDWWSFSLFSKAFDDKTDGHGIEFNDNHSHAEVLAKIKEAMEELP